MIRAGAALGVAAALLSGCGEGEPAARRGIFDVRTAEGRPFRFAETFGEWAIGVVARPVDGTAARIVVARDDPVLGLVVPRLPDDATLALWVAGCRELPLTPGVALRLEPGLRVRLRVVAEGGLPPSPYELHVSVRWRGAGDGADAPLRHELPGAAPEGWYEEGGSDGRSAFPALVATAERPEIECRVGAPGRHRVTWSLMKVERSPHGWVGSGMAPSDAGTSIDVKDVPDEQVFDLPISRAQRREAGG